MGIAGKTHIQAVIRGIAKRAPWGVRRALLDGIGEREGRDQLLSQLAREAGITAFTADGELGLIDSSSADATLITTYGRTGKWAAGTVAHLMKVLSGGGTYLDVGANVGMTTIPIARNTMVKCFAFEPDPTNYQHLVANVRRHCHHDNVETVQAAVMASPGSLSFGLSNEGNPGDHRVVVGPTDRQVIEVKGIALDQFLPEIEGTLAAKIDTQGAEPFVVAGGRKALAKANAVVMEFWPFGMKQMNADPEAVYSLVSHFTQVDIATGERDTKQQLAGGKEAIPVLSAHYLSGVTDPFKYWDLYLAK